jgi:hypothetical protein
MRDYFKYFLKLINIKIQSIKDEEKEIVTGLDEIIPKKKRMETIEHNANRVVGAENGPLRDIETGKFTEKKYRGVPKK